MSTDALPCGSLVRQPPSVVADRAARHLLSSQSPRAVTVDPRGRVFVEPPADAVEMDLVGVYAPDLGLLALSRVLIEDLRFEVAARQFRPRRGTRHADRP